MREIYSFRVNRETEQEVKKETDSGTLVTKEKVSKPIKIIFKKPNRVESEEADVVSAVEYSDSIRKGILTKPLLEKLYDEKGGFLAENYEDKYGKLLGRFYELENESYRLRLKENPTTEDKEEINRLAGEFVTIRNKLQELESSRNSLFQNTAENRAQSKTIFWLTLFLTYIQEDESKEPIPFFLSKSTDYKEAFDQKRDDYDKKIEENSEFSNEIIDKASYFVSLWYLGRCKTPEDFKEIEDILNPKPVETEVPKPSEELVKPSEEPVKTVEEIPAPAENDE